MNRKFEKKKNKLKQHALNTKLMVFFSVGRTLTIIVISKIKTFRTMNKIDMNT